MTASLTHLQVESARAEGHTITGGHDAAEVMMAVVAHQFQRDIDDGRVKPGADISGHLAVSFEARNIVPVTTRDI